MSTPHSTPPEGHRPGPSTPPRSGAPDDAARDVPRSAARLDDTRRLDAESPRETAPSAPGPVADDAASRPPADAPDGRHRINPARLEVRVRRLALLGLVLVPVGYFIAQSLR